MTELRKWNDDIVKSLSSLHSIDPLTLSGQAAGLDDSEPARKAVHSALKNADELVRERMMREYFGVGPLADLLSDRDITEIMINGSDAIFFEKSGQLGQHNDHFISRQNYRSFVTRLCRDANIQANLDLPYADGQWNGCRVHLIIPPASGDEAVLTLRKHPANPWTFARLEATQWATPQALQVLRTMVTEKKNFLVIGGTGTGKTSVLNACLNEIPQHERSVIIEDTSEIKRPNDLSVKLLTRRDPHGHLKEVDQSELLRQALRMRPDRLVMGEIRGGEAKDLLMAFATGHVGCMGTLHAESARQALIRLEMLIQLGAPQWSLSAVRTLIWLSLQNVVVVNRDANGGRRLEGIYRIASLEEIGFLIERIA